MDLLAPDDGRPAMRVRAGLRASPTDAALAEIERRKGERRAREAKFAKAADDHHLLGKFSQNEAALRNGIPATTFKDYLKTKGKNGTQGECLKALTFNSECQLVYWIAVQQTVRHPPTKKEVFGYAALLSEVEQSLSKQLHRPIISIGFVNGEPSKGWWRTFRSDWDSLVRCPPPVPGPGPAVFFSSSSRAKVTQGYIFRSPLPSFSPFTQLKYCSPNPHDMARYNAEEPLRVAGWFQLYKEKATNYLTENIFVGDETPCGGKPPQLPMSVGVKVRGAPFNRVTAGRAAVMTLMAAFNSTGNGTFACISKGGSLKAELVIAADRVGMTVCHKRESSMMDHTVMLEWLKDFVEKTGASPSSRVLLILDGHSSHNMSCVIEAATNAGVDLLFYPGQLTHLLAAPDLSFFGPLKKKFGAAFATIDSAHADPLVVLSCAIDAIEKMDLPKLCAAGFRAAGLNPFDPQAVLDKLPERMLYTDALKALAASREAAAAAEEGGAAPEEGGAAAEEGGAHALQMLSSGSGPSHSTSSAEDARPLAAQLATRLVRAAGRLGGAMVAAAGAAAAAAGGAAAARRAATPTCGASTCRRWTTPR